MGLDLRERKLPGKRPVYYLFSTALGRFNAALREGLPAEDVADQVKSPVRRGDYLFRMTGGPHGESNPH